MSGHLGFTVEIRGKAAMVVPSEYLEVVITKR